MNVFSHSYPTSLLASPGKYRAALDVIKCNCRRLESGSVIVLLHCGCGCFFSQDFEGVIEAVNVDPTHPDSDLRVPSTRVATQIDDGSVLFLQEVSLLPLFIEY